MVLRAADYCRLDGIGFCGHMMSLLNTVENSRRTWHASTSTTAWLSISIAPATTQVEKRWGCVCYTPHSAFSMHTLSSRKPYDTRKIHALFKSKCFGQEREREAVSRCRVRVFALHLFRRRSPRFGGECSSHVGCISWIIRATYNASDLLLWSSPPPRPGGLILQQERRLL